MSAKRSAASILDFFTKKVKDQTSSVRSQNLTEEISLIDFTNPSTSSGDENIATSSTTEVFTGVGASNLSNVNNLLGNRDESPIESTLVVDFDKSSNINSLIPSSETTNSITSNSINQQVIIISKCDLYCCNSTTPYHPNREDELTTTTIDKRLCQKRWFEDYPWLTFCKVEKKVFCFPCREAFQREIHPNKTKLNPTHRSFIADRCCDWKNALSRFRIHETTKLHLDSVYVVNQQTKPTITAQLLSATKRQQEQRRQAFSIEISCILYLLRQGLALRGHTDEDSNLIQLLKLRAADNQFLKEWINDKKYLSHDIINELCKEIYLTIIRNIVKEISDRKWFSLICDESCDASTGEQLCITIRSVDNDYRIFKNVIGLYKISAQDAPTIVEAILDALTRCGLNLVDCRGQSYDGASNMSGIYAGVSALILKQQPKATYVHCVAHCLDLAIHDLTNECFTIRNCMSFVKEIIDFVRRSPKRLAILQQISNEMSMSCTNLTSLCPTRWTMRTESYTSLLNNYGLVQETLCVISEEKGHPSIKANGLFEQMYKFNFFFGLKLGHLIFTYTEKLSRILQSSECCLQDAFCAAESVIYHFQRIKCDDNFKLFYHGILKDSEDLIDKPVLPRHRQPPKRFNLTSTSTQFTDCEEYYHKQYTEALEIVINMLQIRFTQKNFELLCAVEKFILNVSNNPPDDSNEQIRTIIDFCDGDVDMEKLKAEVLMILDFLKSVINTYQMKIKQITKISTICEILNVCVVGKQMFKEFDKLLRLYLTIPVTTATAERTFSTLNRLKNALRTSMTQSRLNHCLLTHIYKEKLDEIDPNKIMSTFISSHEKRQAFFGLLL